MFSEWQSSFHTPLICRQWHHFKMQSRERKTMLNNPLEHHTFIGKIGKKLSVPLIFFFPASEIKLEIKGLKKIFSC